MSEKGHEGENPLKQPSVTVQPGQAEDMIRRGGEAAVGTESPTFMRQEQQDAQNLPKHTIIDKGQSKG